MEYSGSTLLSVRTRHRKSLCSLMICMFCLVSLLYVCYDDNLNDSVDPPVIYAPVSFHGINAAVHASNCKPIESSQHIHSFSFAASSLRAPPAFS